MNLKSGNKKNVPPQTLVIIGLMPLMTVMAIASLEVIGPLTIITPAPLEDPLTEEEKRLRKLVNNASSKDLPFLTSQLDSDTSEDIELALLAISRTKSHKAIPILITYLDHSHPDIRGAAYAGLGHVRKKTYIPALISGLNDTSMQVRARAHKALERTTQWQLDCFDPTADHKARQMAIEMIKRSYESSKKTTSLSMMEI